MIPESNPLPSSELKLVLEGFSLAPGHPQSHSRRSLHHGPFRTQVISLSDEAIRISVVMLERSRPSRPSTLFNGHLCIQFVCQRFVDKTDPF